MFTSMFVFGEMFVVEQCGSFAHDTGFGRVEQGTVQVVIFVDFGGVGVDGGNGGGDGGGGVGGDGDGGGGGAGDGACGDAAVSPLAPG